MPNEASIGAGLLAPIPEILDDPILLPSTVTPVTAFAGQRYFNKTGREFEPSLPENS
jgi:hypothetical protein